MGEIHFGNLNTDSLPRLGMRERNAHERITW